MIITQDTFVCKPGNASKLAKMCKEYMSDDPSVLHVMTDMTGQWHRVIIVSQHESLAAYEKMLAEMMADTPKNREMGEKFKDMNDMYVSGSREIFRVW